MGRFLIADQDEQLCREIADYLRENGHTTRQAHDCPSAIRLVREQGFDVVISSSTLPGGRLPVLLRAVRDSGAETVVMAPLAPPAGCPIVLPAGGISLEEVERSLLLQAMTRAGGVRERAAGLLGISTRALGHRMHRLRIPTNNPNG